jgi:hypothetical protein
VALHLHAFPAPAKEQILKKRSKHGIRIHLVVSYGLTVTQIGCDTMLIMPKQERIVKEFPDEESAAMWASAIMAKVEEGERAAVEEMLK